MAGLQPANLAPKDVEQVRKMMQVQQFDGNTGTSTGGSFKTAASVPSVLVLYDGSGPYNYIGNIYARQMANLLSRWKYTINIEPVESYTAGQIAGNTATFYFGTTYDNTLPAAFISDAMTTAKPLVWLGYNLWKIAWNPDYSINPAFAAKFGFQFNYMDGIPYKIVTYKNQTLDADPWSNGLANLTFTNTNKAKVPAWAGDNNGTVTAYMVHSGNLWYIGENPLQDNSTNLTVGRTAVFEDSLHDMLGDGVTIGTHKAVLRIEDVHANTDPDALRAIADYLYNQKVPYVICVIPHYRDPLGYYTGGVPQDQLISTNPDVVSALQYMQSKGGQIIMHGDTHQYDDQIDTVSGVSGDDYEFYRLQPDSTGAGNDILLGPATEDSTAWVHGKIQEGFAVLAAMGFSSVTGWNTPHYLASLLDYQEFKADFKYSMCRGKTFGVDTSGNSYILDQMISWPIVDDLGMARMPENLGYVSTAKYGVTGQRPANLTASARIRYKVMRDGWVGMYFHPFLNLQLLQKLVGGMKSIGYTFVNPSQTLVGQ